MATTATTPRIRGVWTMRSKVAFGDVTTPIRRASRPGNGWGEGAESVMGRMGEAKAERDGAGAVRQRRMSKHDARTPSAVPRDVLEWAATLNCTAANRYECDGSPSSLDLIGCRSC